ncbi:alpha-(1-_6)-mannopyranosyltransferase A [Corynebacterium kozikiae]|uniref:alpha-(1->6)-mannopyranosyltransferase A n=1 Tax=Corynebacterium kozikiae TaxID=2968469 RepID=UPI00211BEE5F|nr:alpha-(1->6)-mannopyranosyltransferase A [Corynebacterium sp. 76QC2CO]MCQ9342271.1 alpha-(1->6)-mannopyranosyltransferase A [Corynebacterium sp. 76QC2CO]
MDRLMARVRSLFAAIDPVKLGVVASTLVALGSFGGGAIRQSGGVLEFLGLEFLKFGHGAGISNVTLWLGTLLFVLAWIALGVQIQRYALDQMRRVLLWWVVPLVFAAPIMSRDIYSYLMQGTLLRDGFDAYTQGPAVNPGPLLTEVSQDWRNTTTPYGPLHLWLGEAITSVTGDNITAGVVIFKVLSVGGFALIAWSVAAIAKHLGMDPVWALWLGVANPVMVFHLVGGMHNESMMVGLVMLGLYWALRGRFYPAVAVIAVAMALKVTAAFSLPFVVWIAVRRHKQRTFGWFMAYALSGAALTIAMLALITYASGASWGWIAALTGNSKVINPLAFPSLFAGLVSQVGSLFVEPFPYNSVLQVTRTVSMGLMALGCVAAWWWGRNSQVQALRGTAVAYLVAFFFNAVTLPWYYASILPLLGLIAPSKRVQQIAIILSVAIGMAFTGSGNHQLYQPFWMTIWALLGFVAAMCITVKQEKREVLLSDQQNIHA